MKTDADVGKFGEVVQKQFGKDDVSVGKYKDGSSYVYLKRERAPSQFMWIMG